MRTIPLAVRATRELSLGSMSALAWYELQRKTGWLRLQMPIKDWDKVRLEDFSRKGVPTEPIAYSLYRLGTRRTFFFDSQTDLSASLSRILNGVDEILITEADEILSGRFRLFGGPAIHYGSPPDWMKFPKFGSDPDIDDLFMDAHWTALKLDDFPEDIKLLWEPARFGWAYVLGRAYRLSGDKKFAEGFWRLFESWREQNPPNQGPHWISAQEVSIRLMALVFSLYAFHSYLIEDPGRIVQLVETILAHAERIPPTLLYSRAQGNNHLIVEAVGVYTVGLLFPEMRLSGRWRAEGRRWLIKALSKQIFPDGGYVQHSANYHRLALQAAFWAIRLGQLNGDDFPIHILTALRNATFCLGSMMETSTGYVPNFGSNDGALLLPVTTCAFQDFRPVMQLAHRCLSMEEPFKAGPWDEACFWFGFLQDGTRVRETGRFILSEGQSFQRKDEGTDLARNKFLSGTPMEFEKEVQAFPQAGLYFLRGVEAWGMFRCASFTQRPGHSDQLHLDLWWRGENIACDAGTYLYNGVPPWQNGLSTVKVHNTLVVDEKEPMSRASRFLWLDWAQGALLRHHKSKDGALEFISGTHDGYEEMDLRINRSIIRAGDELYMVVDDVIGSGHHSLRCGWLLPDVSWELDGASILLRSPIGQYQVEFGSSVTQWALYRAGQLLEGEELTNCPDLLGWFSPTYAVKQPALYFAASSRGALPLRIVSLWRLGDADPKRLKVDWDDSASGFSVISRIIYDQTELVL